MKKKGIVGVIRQSKSASDITQGILDLRDDFRCLQRRLGTRSLSHDSIFLLEKRQSDPEPPRVFLQENVQGKIQALQMKLQKQKMHLGPPPLVTAIKQTEDHQHPKEVMTLSKNLPQKTSQGVLPHPISPTLPPFYSSAPSPGVDFSPLPQFMPCLDNSAARHRMSIKPRNQRASTKSRRLPTSDRSRPHSESMIILERPLTERREEDGITLTKEMTHVRSYSSQIIRPGKGLVTPPIKYPYLASPLKLLVGADDDYQPHTITQCKGKEEPAVSASGDAGTKQVLKSAERMVAKRPSSAGPTSHKGSGDHNAKLKGVEGSADSIVGSVYTPCLILLDTEKCQPKADTEFNTVMTHVNSNRVQGTMQEHYQDQPLKPLLLHRNASPVDNKFEGRNVHQILSVPLSSEEGCLQESTNQQRSLSFSVLSEEGHKRQRTGSFTGLMEQSGGKREHVFPLIIPSSNLKTQARVRAIGKDPSQTGATSTPAVSTKLRDLTIAVSTGQERGDSPSNKIQDMPVETQDRVGEADEANKGLKMNTEQNEEKRASEVKLHTTSQSEVNVKQFNTEVRSTPWLLKSSTPTQNDSGPVRETCTVLRSPPLYNSELFISAEDPVISSIPQQGARRDQEKAGLNRFPDLQASAQSPVSSINITMCTPLCVMEKSPLQISAKGSREASTELSWMTMAREKTRSLQQLFTNTLNDLAGLQTATRPAADPLTQIPSQPSAGPIRPKQKTSSTQSSVCPLETQLPTVHASVRATHPTQPPTLESSISPTQPSIDQLGGEDFSINQTISATNQVQPTHLSARPGQTSTHSATKPVQLTGIHISPTQFNPQIIHAAQQQLSQMSIHHAYPVQQSLPQSVTKPQASQFISLSLSPKLTPHQLPHQSPSPALQPRTLGENVSSLPLAKVDWTSISQGKSTGESQAQCTGGLGSKALLNEQWHHQKHDAVKEVDQKSTPDSQTYQSLDELLTISSHSKFTDLAVSPGPMRLDREVKCQKKTLMPLSPSSSPRLQSYSDSRQPSWMELAKRKSMAWSDKTMD